MINANNAARKTMEANDKHKKRVLRKLKHRILTWNLLTKIAIAKGNQFAETTYSTKFNDSIFMEEAVLYLKSLGYHANYYRHGLYDTKYTLRRGW
jgi:hypothetical protein